MTKVTRFVQYSLAGLLVMALASCAPPIPTTQDIVGLWVERRDSSRVKDGGPCAYFEFAEGGKFEAHQVPREYFILDRSLPLEHLTRVDVTGTWSLDTSSKDPFAIHRLDLNFGPVVDYPLGFTSHLSITYPPERTLLAGVPDNPWVTFYRKTVPGCQ